MQRQQHPAQIRDLLQLRRQVLPRQQTGYVDGVAEKVVLHGNHLSPQGWEIRPGLLQQVCHERRRRRAGGDGEGGGRFAVLLHAHGAEEVLLQ